MDEWAYSVLVVWIFGIILWIVSRIRRVIKWNKKINAICKKYESEESENESKQV